MTIAPVATTIHSTALVDPTAVLGEGGGDATSPLPPLEGTQASIPASSVGDWIT